MRNVHRLKLLATDLDGTLIPLSGNSCHQHDLRNLADSLAQNDAQLVFVTGRHFDSVVDAISEFNLPKPKTIICDVGSSVFRLDEKGAFEADANYSEALQAILGVTSLTEIRNSIVAKQIPELRPQEDFKQGAFKLSFYSTAELLSDHVDQVQAVVTELDGNCEIISSVDPFNGDGLIDLLPSGVSKAFALNWLCEAKKIARESVVFAGDSGNDLAAMIAGYNTIVVGNADPKIAESVRTAHAANNWIDRLHVATASATSGVLEGWKRFNKLNN